MFTALKLAGKSQRNLHPLANILKCVSKCDSANAFSAHWLSHFEIVQLLKILEIMRTLSRYVTYAVTNRDSQSVFAGNPNDR